MSEFQAYALASGSSRNATLIHPGETAILIDASITLQKLMVALLTAVAPALQGR